jgi:hypothetical protein
MWISEVIFDKINDDKICQSKKLFPRMKWNDYDNNEYYNYDDDDVL